MINYLPNVSNFSFRIISSIKKELSLINIYSRNTSRLILPGNLQGRMEIGLHLIHINRFTRLPSLDKMLLSLLIPLLIFQIQCIFQVHIPHLMFRVLLRHLKGLLKVMSITQILDNHIHQVKFQEHFHSLVITQSFRPFFGQLTSLFFVAILTADSNRVFPQIGASISFYSQMPVPTLDIMVFRHFQIAVLLEFLRDRLMGVFQEVFPEFRDQSNHVVKLESLE